MLQLPYAKQLGSTMNMYCICRLSPLLCMNIISLFAVFTLSCRLLKVWTTTKKYICSHTHTHNHFVARFPGLPGWASARRNLLDLRVQGKIMEADTPTIQLGTTPSGLISDPPSSSPHFYARCRSCHNPPNLSWLGTGTKYAGLHT